MPDRPLSPHLSVYRWKYTLVSSIVNRATGLALTAGFLVLLYWVMALFRGPLAYARAEVVLAHPLFKIVFSGFLWAFSYHLIAGIRHLIWDTGHGLERTQSQRTAWLVGIVSVLMAVGLIYWALCPAVAP